MDRLPADFDPSKPPPGFYPPSSLCQYGWSGPVIATPHWGAHRVYQPPAGKHDNVAWYQHQPAPYAWPPMAAPYVGQPPRQSGLWHPTSGEMTDSTFVNRQPASSSSVQSVNNVLSSAPQDHLPLQQLGCSTSDERQQPLVQPVQVLGTGEESQDGAGHLKLLEPAPVEDLHSFLQESLSENLCQQQQQSESAIVPSSSSIDSKMPIASSSGTENGQTVPSFRTKKKKILYKHPGRKSELFIPQKSDGPSVVPSCSSKKESLKTRKSKDYDNWFAGNRESSESSNSSSESEQDVKVLAKHTMKKSKKSRDPSVQESSSTSGSCSAGARSKRAMKEATTKKKLVGAKAKALVGDHVVPFVKLSQKQLDVTAIPSTSGSSTATEDCSSHHKLSKVVNECDTANEEDSDPDDPVIRPVKKRSLSLKKSVQKNSNEPFLNDSLEPPIGALFSDVIVLRDSDSLPSLPDFDELLHSKDIQPAGQPHQGAVVGPPALPQQGTSAQPLDDNYCSICLDRISNQTEVLMCKPCGCANACVEEAVNWVAEHGTCYQCRTKMVESFAIPFYSRKFHM